MKDTYLILILGWIIYFFIHSLMASLKCKSLFNQLFKKPFKYYRLLYSIVSVIGLIPLAVLHIILPNELIVDQTDMGKVLGLLLAGVGVIVIKQAFRVHNLKSFLGLEPSRETSNSGPSPLKQFGILARVRHPIYTGTISIFLGLVIYQPSITNLISTICVIIYILVGIRLEEARLIEEFGQSYIEYKKKVPMLFPKVF
ncbi:isoprenylcysteine carboxylmethyltransferase family protein [Fulvivirgaceae bacterium BMA10]|uniref:Isoprenylcysteine carboxylmethyltransferase family protein n=1 Tax=Splendidivirga corallicola TaxID=3051826 RepID=A0ABT8KQ18_9BACT|nr:isoprenylcysteine carboxylmethyltransferase family protein [Fulvivirgaceae bacterium BMA10]